MNEITLALEELCSIEKLKLDLILFGFYIYEIQEDQIKRIDPMPLKYKDGFYFKGGGNLNINDEQFYIKDENV